jgi:hypothetical protein
LILIKIRRLRTPLRGGGRIEHAAPMAESQGVGWRRRGLAALVIALAAPLYSCLFFISTSPTPINQANIIVIVRTDDSREPVAGAGVRIRAGGSNEELGRGITNSEGRFASSVSGDVRNLRILIDVPTGFIAPASTSGSIEVALPSGTDQVTVLLARDR